MKADDWLSSAASTLADAGIATPRLDALVLLEDAAKQDRSWLLAHPDTLLNDSLVESLNKQIARRSSHEPLAYIRGKCEFYGREFRVTPATLQPRPETETMVELLLDHEKNTKHKVRSIVDVGTGSGCLAVTAKLELPDADVCATEINKDALTIARQNAKNLGADVKFRQGNLLEPLKYQILNIKYSEIALLANLPYVPDSHTINQAAMQEPKIAIFGGKDGLDLYRDLFNQVVSFNAKPGFILTESLPFQHESLAKIAKNSRYKLHKTKDFIQLFIAF